MHDLTGRISSVSFDYATGKPLITFELNEQRSALDMVDELRAFDKLSLRIGRYKQKRSLDANAYCWVLLSKIAEKTNQRVTDIYRAAIKEVGGNSDTVCIQDHAVEQLCAGWQRNGIGWVTDTMPSKIDGCTNVILYYGSSTYDSATMCRLIEIILQDCAALGIEVKPKEEIDSLLNSWGGE